MKNSKLYYTYTKFYIARIKFAIISPNSVSLEPIFVNVKMEYERFYSNVRSNKVNDANINLNEITNQFPVENFQYKAKHLLTK